MFAFDGTLSLNQITISQPARLKKVIDEQLQTAQTPFLKTIFLYFFEVMGVSKDDGQTLKVLFERLLERKSNVGNEKDFTKVEQDQLKINMDACIFISTTKSAGAQLRQFKRVVKLLVSSLIDLYPAKKELLAPLVTEIRNFSRVKMRVVRFVFTQIGLQIFKQLLA